MATGHNLTFKSINAQRGRVIGLLLSPEMLTFANKQITIFNNLLVSAYLAILVSVCVFVTLYDNNEKSCPHGIHFLSQSGNIVGIIGHLRNNKKMAY